MKKKFPEVVDFIIDYLQIDVIFDRLWSWTPTYLPHSYPLKIWGFIKQACGSHVISYNLRLISTSYCEPGLVVLQHVSSLHKIRISNVYLAINHQLFSMRSHEKTRMKSKYVTIVQRRYAMSRWSVFARCLQNYIREVFRMIFRWRSFRKTSFSFNSVTLFLSKNPAKRFCSRLKIRA